MPDVQYKNLASAKILTDVYTNSTSLEVKASSGNTFPSNPDVKPFYATISDANQIANSAQCEIVKVTNATSSGSNIEFTIERAQRNTTAKNFEANQAILTHAIYTQDVVEPLQDAAYVGSVLSTPSSVAYVATDNIQPSAVTTAKIANGAVTSDKIDWTTLQTIDLSSYIKSDTVTAVNRALAIVFGKIVYLNITVTTVTLAGGGTYTIFEGLPASLRPNETCNIAGALGTKPLARAWVGSNGVIQFTNWEGATTPSVNIGAMYIAG